MSPRILLWGAPALDPPLAEVASALHALGAPYVLVDQAQSQTTQLTLQLTGTNLNGVLHLGPHTYPLQDFHGVYHRPHPANQMPGDPAHSTRLTTALYEWLQLSPALVLNAPQAMATNDSKPLQAALIHLHTQGLLRTPATLLTTSPQAVEAFAARHGELVYKSISGVRSVVSRFTPDHHLRLNDITHCPTQFQEHVPGTDYRVHIVGSELFPCRIVSSADDYRYDPAARVVPTELPPEIAQACLHLAQALSLPLAGIDLRLTPAGEWFCFEVNPSPGFSYFAAQAGQPIAQAIARLLASA
jgi:glutathione synthase/RimK-type ligase-like ATP-grasp enzyme